MTNFKRTISVLLAVVMAFTTMTVAFTVIGSAAPTVPRTAATVLSPSVIFTVPPYLKTYGSDIYQGGSNVSAEGQVQATITPTGTASVENISLACSDAGVQLSARNQATSGESTWEIQGGTLKTAPASDGSTKVKWTLSYTVGGKSYVTYAWSQVRPTYNDPGFGVHLVHKNSLSYQTHNHHVEWIGPVLGRPATETASNYTQGYVHQGQGVYAAATGTYASSYLWERDQGSGDDEKSYSVTTAKGTLYADYSQVQTVEAIGLASVAKTHAVLEDPGNHPQKYLGTAIKSQFYQGAQTDGVYSVSNTGSGSVGVGSARGDVFSGPLPPVGEHGGSAQINAEIHWEGNVDTDALHWQHSYHDSHTYYQIDIATYNKSALWTAISTAMSNNYQASQFRNTNPGTSSRFRSWDQYLEALENAWFIYGKENVSQDDINNAITALTQATPNYNSSGAWVSGMMYADADYSGIESIYSTISQTLDNPDFFVQYSDETYGKYYQYSLAAALIDAIDDIKIEYNLDHDETIEKTPLDARYQGTVDQMRINLMNAVNALIETPQNQTSKLMSVEFNANADGVTGVPANFTTSFTAEITRPTTNPSRQYYRFTGWYFDAETTEPVSWPLYFDPASPYFKADLDTKVDNAGVAYTLYAGWQITGKTLEFNTMGGSEMPMAIGNNGDPYTGPTETPTKTGCRFLGWYTDETLETPVNWSGFTFGSLSVVYAKWTADSFTVTFNANGGKFSGNADTYTVTDLFGSPVAEPTPPTQTGVGFNGWYYDAALTQPVDMSTFTIPGEDIEIFAKWSEDVRNVFFYPENGEDPVFLTVDVGSRVERPADPQKEGFTFKGWYGNPRGTGSPRSFPITIGGNNVALFAIYTPLKFTITFDPGEGVMAPGFNAAAYQNIDCGSTITPPPVPTKTDYVFSTWMLNGEPYELTTVPAQNITLVAAYVEEPYTATFRLRTDATDTVAQGDIITATVSIQANRYVTNHRFVVYYDKRYLTPAKNGVAVTSAISGTSACSSTPGRAYFTLLDNEGGNVWTCGAPTGRVKAGIAPTSQYFPADWAVDNRTLKDEYSNYEFVYYDGPDVSNGTRVRPNGEVDIASFQFLVLPGAPLADGTTEYAQLFMSPEFVRSTEQTGGKIAACLQADAAYSNAKDWDKTINSIVDSDFRFAVTPMQTCRINFITNGGDSLDAIENAKQGGTAQLPTPTRSYYDFLGWTLTNNADDTDYVDASAFPVPMQDSITLYAKWVGKQATYYVRHHKQNATASGFMDNYEQQVLKAAVGTEVTATAKVYAGFTCQNPNLTGIVRGETSNPLILDLWYLRNTTSITLNADGGKFQNQQQMVVLSGLFDTAVTNIPENPTRAGYTFGGWLKDTASYTINKYPATDITLTAKWTAKTITVRFFLGESTTPFSTKIGQYGEALEAPTVSVNEGYVFSGWKNANGTPFTYTTFPAENEDFYGSIVIDGNMLTLYINGRQYGDPIEVQRGTQVTEASIGYTPDPGYNFTGWRTENSADGALAAFPMTLTQDTILYGFTEHVTYSIHTITFFDGEPEDGPFVENLFYGDTFDLPEPDDWSDYGYGFRGWYTDEAMTQLYEKPETMPAQNLLLYGEYYQMTGTVKFDLNGGTGTAPADITRPVNTTVTLPGSAGFSRKFYTFGGWSTSSTGTNPYTSYTIYGEEPVTMYAIWIVNFMTVNFNLNGAEYGTRPASMQVEVGETIAAADLPQGLDFSKEGYIFAGWSDKANATQPLTSFTATGTGSKTLYAVWIADKVTLVAQEGSTTVIDDERGFIYGLEANITQQQLLDSFLGVEGNGHIELEPAIIGTGTKVKVINDFSGNTDATYEIVIFGDVNGDGNVNSSDVTELRNMNAGLVEYAPDSAQYFAADITHDGNVNSSDVTEARLANAGISVISQVIE